MDLKELKERFSRCECGEEHRLDIKDIAVGSGITADTGEILRRNGFKKRLLLVADENTLSAARGIESALSWFDVEFKIYKNLRQAEMSEAEKIRALAENAEGIISVGTGSLNDICRMAAAKGSKPFAIYATAASMDGFASYSAPLTDGNFKVTYPAKSPEVIIADTRVLAAAPAVLKSAGFGDMVGKYTGLIDWQVSHILTGEYYCEKVAELTRSAADRIMSLADRITANDEESAAAVFEALLLTGIGTSFTRTSRPASGTEHILSHYWECKKLLAGELSDFHGRKVGVATLYIMRLYGELYKKERVRAHGDTTNWEEVYADYGALAPEVKRLNTPRTVTDGLDPAALERNWDKVREIIASSPSYEEIRAAMIKAGCAMDNNDIGVSDKLRDSGLKYHPYMRNRMSLRRLLPMID